MMSERERSNIRLRDVEVDDLPIFFEYQCDPDANYMAAFTSKDPTNREAFMAHWARILDDETTVNQTILCNEQVVGHISSYPHEDEGKPEVSYWLDQASWGRGIATEALSTFLSRIQARPVYARVAADNAASLRVLEKCGFVRIGTNRDFANARGQKIEEFLLQLT
ncbi:MAG: GNAT family N-acetyltransferase [Ktedonobacteraceae bacterium]|nr:GNAT family N-acetyltransferase [Ktedonobacteraceae bacterium]